MVQDIKITPTPISYSGSVATATGEPQLLFRGSGASATDIELKDLKSFFFVQTWLNCYQ